MTERRIELIGVIYFSLFFLLTFVRFVSLPLINPMRPLELFTNGPRHRRIGIIANK